RKNKRVTVKYRTEGWIGALELISKLEQEEALVLSKKIHEMVVLFPFDRDDAAFEGQLRAWYKEMSEVDREPLSHDLTPTQEGYRFTIRNDLHHTMPSDVVISLADRDSDLPPPSVQDMLSWIYKVEKQCHSRNREPVIIRPLSTETSAVSFLEPREKG